jgi:hypothetical protein
MQNLSDGPATWSLEDIAYGKVDLAQANADPCLFYILAAASFVEITSDLYTRNLVEFFRGDAEIVDWLQHHWEIEELQHGKALQRYVETVWPEFPWLTAYDNFFADYSRLCRLELFAPSQALEMVARCVIETGTATLYRTIAASTSEPVLRDLASRIAKDEVRHYKYFYKFFQNFRTREGVGRMAVAQELWRKHAEVRYDDIRIAFKHSFEARNAGKIATPAEFSRHWQQMLALMRDQYPMDMAVKMIMKPLDLGPSIGRIAVPLATRAARSAMRFLAH